MLTQAILRAYVDYDPMTGSFTSTRTGKRVGFVDRKPHTNYTGLKIQGRIYRAHRLAFLWLYGEIPDVVDHVNGIGTDNRLVNLRAATIAENNRNRHVVRALSGLKGVTHYPDRFQRPYRARCSDTRGKQRHLGYFATPMAAHQAYCEAAAIYHRDFSNYGASND